jgi:hypothetical protein
MLPHSDAGSAFEPVSDFTGVQPETVIFAG